LALVSLTRLLLERLLFFPAIDSGENTTAAVELHLTAMTVTSFLNISLTVATAVGVGLIPRSLRRLARAVGR
jgi:hypothetical protein